MRCIWFVRHAESTVNCGGESVFDPGLSENGKHQAATLEGHFDVVIISPLLRCLETLRLSKITYGELRVSPNLQEWRCAFPATRLSERDSIETKEEFEDRVERFRLELAAIDAKTILVIGHSHFWNIWRKIESPYFEIQNASIVQVIGA